jgi:hypothetical protein
LGKWATDDLLINHTSPEHTLLERLIVLALHAVLDSIEHSVDGGLGLEAGFSAFLEDASPDEDGVPVGFVGVLVVIVGASNVRLRRVADKVACPSAISAVGGSQTQRYQFEACQRQ